MGDLYVVDKYGNADLNVFDGATGAAITTLGDTYFSQPRGVSIGADGNAYVNGVSLIYDPEKGRRHVGFMHDTLPAHRDMFQADAELLTVSASAVASKIFVKVRILYLLKLPIS